MRRLYLLLPILAIPAGCKPDAATSPTVAPPPSAAQPAAAEPIDVSKLVGVWNFTKAEGVRIPRFTVEFRKDGTLRMTSKNDDMEFKREGKYTLEEDEITMIVPGPQNDPETRIVRILKLTDDELIFEEVNLKMEFKRGK